MEFRAPHTCKVLPTRTKGLVTGDSRYRVREGLKIVKNYKTDANRWMRENGHSWGPKKENTGGPDAKRNCEKFKRIRRGKVLEQKVGRFESVRDFCESNRDFKGHDCLFVPAAQEHIPAKVNFCGKTIPASRYMCLLTHGSPNMRALRLVISAVMVIYLA